MKQIFENLSEVKIVSLWLIEIHRYPQYRPKPITHFWVCFLLSSETIALIYERFYFQSCTTYTTKSWSFWNGLGFQYFIFGGRTLKQRKESSTWPGLSLTFLLYFKGGLVGAEEEGELVRPSITRSSRQNRLGTPCRRLFYWHFSYL